MSPRELLQTCRRLAAAAMIARNGGSKESAMARERVGKYIDDIARELGVIR